MFQCTTKSIDVYHFIYIIDDYVWMPMPCYFPVFCFDAVGAVCAVQADIADLIMIDIAENKFQRLFYIQTLPILTFELVWGAAHSRHFYYSAEHLSSENR